MPLTIYQAGPLFSQAEKEFHRKLSAALRAAGHTVVWPGDLLSEAAIAAAGPGAVALIHNACKEAIHRCAAVVALLDGPQVDDGTAWEIGYAHARGLPVFGLRTDSRVAGDTPHNRMNSMVEGCLAGLAQTLEELAALLEGNGRALG